MPTVDDGLRLWMYRMARLELVNPWNTNMVENSAFEQMA